MTDVARLHSIAAQLAARVHEDDPDANLRWLRAQLGVDMAAPVTDTERLCFALATAVPINRRWRDLVDWACSDEDRLNRRVVHKAQPELSTGERRRRPQAGLPATDAAARLAADLLVERFGPRSEERAA